MRLQKMQILLSGEAGWIPAWQCCPSLLALRRVSKAPLSHEPIIGGFGGVFPVQYTATGVLLAID